jgi:5-methylcytosine-specific restriction endonuclease McrA
MIKRFHSIYDFPDYQEYADKFDDRYPDWFVNDQTLMDANHECRYCGEQIPATREYYCTDTCNLYFKYAAHDTKVNSLRRFMHKYYKFECQGCHTHLSYFAPSKLELPIYIGETDHVIPLKDGGKNLISNLQLLCFKCHMRKTLQQR